jgi:predicted nucleotidyltransferase
MESAAAFIERATRWAEAREDVRAMALVGSHARGAAGPASDVDLVLLCSDPDRYVVSAEWVRELGAPGRVEIEDWGLIRSVRVFFEDGPEVELGIGGTGWVASPPPPGTMEVLAGGVTVLLDRDGALTQLARAAANS